MFHDVSGHLENMCQEDGHLDNGSEDGHLENGISQRMDVWRMDIQRTDI